MTLNELILETAEQYLGMTETKDRAELSKLVGVDVKTTPWCAAFVNTVLKERGITGTNSNLARSFIKFGTRVELKDAQPGDIVVFRRGTQAWQGHVAFFKSQKVGGIIVLGGNQGDMVSERLYRLGDLITIRRSTNNG